MPSLAAAYTAVAVTAGRDPGAARPTLTCHSVRGVTDALNSGSGPIFFVPPQSQSNDGTGIDGIHDESDEQPPTASSAARAAAQRR